MRMNDRPIFTLIGLLLCSVFIQQSDCAEKVDFAFKSAGEGFYTFNTGVLRGTLQADSKSQGITSLVDISTGTELAYGKDNPGLLSYYRFLSTDHRYGDTARSMPKTSRILPDGALEILWPSAEDHPFELLAIYRWKSSDSLDLETIIRPQIELPQFEVFLSSYFNKNCKSWIYVQAPISAPGNPQFLAADVNSLVSGTYLAFPRDRKAAQMFYDGRWNRGSNPVHFSITKFLAAPMCMKKDTQSGISVLFMSPMQDCFAVDTPYNMEPPDGVAGHYSLYLSLLGETLLPEQSRHAYTRLVAKKNMSEKDAIEQYSQYLQEIH